MVVKRLRSLAAEPRPLDARGRAHLAGAVERVLSVLPTDSPCLVNSCVLLALLERRGIASSLVIGVRAGTDFAAHAWIECEGEPQLPTGGGEYARLTEL